MAHSIRLLPRPALLWLGALALAPLAHAQTQPTEPPPTPAPTAAPTTPVPTITTPVIRLLPALEAAEARKLAVAVPGGGSVVFETSTDFSGWVSDSASVSATGVGVVTLEKSPTEPRRFYRLRNVP